MFFNHDRKNCHLEEGNTDAVSYAYGLNVSGTLQGAGGIGGLLSRNSATGKFLYLYDLNGNVGQLVAATTGELAAHYEYDPFGKALVASGPEAEKNPFRFSTKLFDIDTGLYYYGYRYYSPRLGRWITRDRIEEAGGLNLYGAVGNNAINAIDLYGLLRKGDITSGRTVYTCNCGWVDITHLDAARQLSQMILQGIRNVQPNSPEWKNTIELRLNFMLAYGYVAGNVSISSDVTNYTNEQQLRLALDIFWDFEMSFEYAQSLTLGDIAGHSGFSADDLPTDMLGFLLQAGIISDWKTLCDPLDLDDIERKKSQRVFEHTHATHSSLHRGHKPLLVSSQDLQKAFVGCDPCRDAYNDEASLLFDNWTPHTANIAKYRWLKVPQSYSAVHSLSDFKTFLGAINNRFF